MAVLIRDAGVESRVRAERQRSDAARWDEVWDGVLVMPPMPNNEHQRLVVKLCAIFSGLLDWDAGESCLPGANVSDREEEWQFNYRVPDVVVVRKNSRAIDRGTHWVGGPDLVMEIISPGEEPYAKHAFYASIGVREVLVLQREPTILERFIIQNAALVKAGRCESSGGEVSSEVLPLRFRIRNRQLVVESTQDGSTWAV